MADKQNISRRHFVSTAVSVVALSALPVRRVVPGVLNQGRDPERLTNRPGWQDQGLKTWLVHPIGNSGMCPCMRSP
jgi:hypothetical protein